MMKKVLLSALFIAMTTVIFAQKLNVTSAYTYLRRGYMDKAKNSIESAITHKDTKSDPNTWLCRGQVYLGIYKSTKSKYAELKPGSLDTAYRSFQVCYELDSLKEYNQELGMGLLECGTFYFNKGVDLFQNDKNYKASFLSFKKMTDIRDLTKMYDSAYIHALTYGVYAYQNIKDSTEKAPLTPMTMMNLEKLVLMCNVKAIPYLTYSEMLKAVGDTAKALDVIKQGRINTQDHLDLIVAEANIYLLQNRGEEAKATLQTALEKDPNNPYIHFHIAQQYAEAGDIEKSQQSYAKAIEIKPDYFDAIFNLGALYYNAAADVYAAADELPLGDENYDKLIAQANDYFTQALPYLLKAEELQPSDFPTLVSLKQIFVKQKNWEEAKRVGDKIKALQQK